MFENICFQGQFRSYQQSILDGADEYLRDGKIHIVAAPGSGKTILGLELICRLHSSCLIFSPTTTIRNQWGERFSENFLNGEGADRYLSYDLNDLKPLTSVTYQALHAAMKRERDEEEGTDYTALDLVAAVKSYGVKTICLDEAHHLRSEWQKALENFLSALEGEIKVIALTATPPYDAKPNEWKRYVDVCGEIDEEIFVPELVKSGTLCPHQDYLYFNYPTQEETKKFKAYRERAAVALEELLSSVYLQRAYDRLRGKENDYDFLYENTQSLVALLALCKQAGISVDKKLIRRITTGNRLPSVTSERAGLAVNYLLHGALLTPEEQDACGEIFKRNSVFEHGEVCLELNEKLKKELVSSVGKLKSIREITAAEATAKGEALRLLVLTDYIKKESLSVIGSDTPPDCVSVVSVFETVRNTGVCVGAVSGSLVILPDGCADGLRERGARFTLSPLGNTGYSSYDFHADNRQKVRFVSELLAEGRINVLVGTKSLLGEGWDAPCVNSLILASFVGSFMLSNQMRGRAIRTDKNQPQKTANIWHLVTIERPFLYAEKRQERYACLMNENKNELTSCDFETVSRRFDCFVAPNYATGEIESGIARVSILQPPFDEKGIARINGEMIKRACEGDKLCAQWDEALTGSARLNEVSDIPKEGRTPPFLFVNIVYAALILSVFSFVLTAFISSFFRSIPAVDDYRYLIAVLAGFVLVFALIKLQDLCFNKILAHLNPVRSVRTFAECILKAMQKEKLVAEGARVKAEADPQGILIQVELLNASVHDQNVFHGAIKELLSPIENPRYLLIPRGAFGRLRYRHALACPEILGRKNEYAECIAKELKRSMGKIETVYTRSEEGRKLILKCRKKAYITENENVLYGRRKHVSRWE